jgi:tRNA(His) 5'-end guanylyltransferase
MRYLCENIQGCVLGYTQSDEITLILIDYKKLTSSAWFDYEVQKMCSIAASMATMAFNKFFYETVQDWYWEDPLVTNLKLPSKENLKEIYTKALDKGAMFDARVFNIPKEEVANLIYWRQLDATRNSIQMVGQANFSHKELQNKSCNQIQDMLFQEKDINWNDFPTHLKRGSCCIKNNTNITFARSYGEEVETGAVERPHWEIDLEIPIFKEEGRRYINDLILYDDGEPKPVVIF